jgi:hypothetical protein
MSANNLVNTKADLIAALVQRELLESASLSMCVGDYSSLAMKGAKSVSIPKLSSFTVQDRAFGAAASENAPLTDAVDVINLDKNKIVLFSYDSHDEQQSSIDYMANAIARAARAHGRQVNSDIITLWESVAELNINAGVPADITIDDILDMREQLIASYADMSTVKLVIAADQEKAMLKLPEFSRYDYRGNGPSPIVNGTIGFVYGVPVILNQQVKAQQAFMVAPEGSGLAFQKAPAVAEQSDVKYGTGGKLVAVDQLYGVGGLELEAAGAAAGKSPLICKLAD